MHHTYTIVYHGRHATLAAYTLTDTQGIAEAYAYADNMRPDGTKYYSILRNGVLLTQVVV